MDHLPLSIIEELAIHAEPHVAADAIRVNDLKPEGFTQRLCQH